MKKYIKKPIPIHAFKWDGKISTLKKYFNIQILNTNLFTISSTRKYGLNALRIKTLVGNETAPVGDYIIKGIHGELYPCSPKIFKESYKEVK